MLFNSYPFIAFFLPLSLLGFYGLVRHLGLNAALSFLVLGSLFFYGWWNPIYLPLILTSMLVNYTAGRWLSQAGKRDGARRAVVSAGVVFNLALLGYFKYANFFVDSTNYMFEAGIQLERIALPLAISFFTFQQISFVVECYRVRSHCPHPLHYAFFVVFFPQLIAGPIVRSDQVFPQLDRSMLRFDPAAMSVGATMFIFGLFKKVVIADNVAKFSSPVFDALPGGAVPTTTSAWLAIFSYSLQLYFDFSGYSDMAIGLARMFNVKLPANFDSPYKSRNVGEFWRRWHMTLSTFLRDYLYIPLGGNRGSSFRLRINLMVTMVLGGLWHGAGWGFVLWGTLNGVFLLVHRGFRMRLGKSERHGTEPAWYIRELSITFTFFCIMLSRVTFRAPDWESSVLMWKALLGIVGGGLSLAEIVDLKLSILTAMAVYGISRYAPNTQELLAEHDPVIETVKRRVRLRWSPSAVWAGVTVAAALLSLLSLSEVSEFLYFQF